MKIPILQFKLVNVFCIEKSRIENWTKNNKLTKEMIDFAINKVGGKLAIRIFPRHMIKEVWNYDKPEESFHFKEYAFRAFANGDIITIFDDETEVPDSLFWILLHEVGHVLVTRTTALSEQFRPMQVNRTRYSDNENGPEEQFANLMADTWYKEFNGTPNSFHRLWWKQRIVG